MAHESGQAGFIIFALFYLGFVTFVSAAWPGSSGAVTGDLTVPTLPAQPGILEYLSFAISTAWFYITAFFSFNINVPVLGIISTVITLAMFYIIASLIRGSG